MKKSFNLLSILSLCLILCTLAACSPASGESSVNQDIKTGLSSSESSENADGSLTKICVAASPQPHAEILELVQDQLKQEGIDLEIREFTDYVLPNIATQDGDVDANYFQHQPYLEQFNAENQTNLIALGPVHYEPFALYPGKLKSLDALQDGASIGLPNDVSNQARALLLLQDLGWISLPEDKASLELTILDILDNPHHIKFAELAAAQLPRSLDDLDYAVINGNYALEAGLSVSKDALAVEDQDSLAAKTYANVLVTRDDLAQDPNLLKLYEALQSSKVREVIAEKYQGAVLAVDANK